MEPEKLSHKALRLMNTLAVAVEQAAARRKYFFDQVRCVIVPEERLRIKAEYISLYVHRALKGRQIDNETINKICLQAAGNFEILRSKLGTVYLLPEGNPNTIAREWIQHFGILTDKENGQSDI